jgi:hypothetical protein
MTRIGQDLAALPVEREERRSSCRSGLVSQ